FTDSADRFYFGSFVRMLENGNLLLFDNGSGRPAAEGGYYSRALELALDWDSMTATKVWEYRHQVEAGATPVYKYADKVGSAQRLKNGNTLIMFGATRILRLVSRRTRRLLLSSRPMRTLRPARWPYWTSRFLPERVRSIGPCR